MPRLSRPVTDRRRGFFVLAATSAARPPRTARARPLTHREGVASPWRAREPRNASLIRTSIGERRSDPGDPAQGSGRRGLW